MVCMHGPDDPGRNITPQRVQQVTILGLARASCCGLHALSCMCTGAAWHAWYCGGLTCVLGCWGALWMLAQPSCVSCSDSARHYPHLGWLAGSQPALHAGWAHTQMQSPQWQPPQRLRLQAAGTTPFTCGAGHSCSQKWLLVTPSPAALRKGALWAPRVAQMSQHQSCPQVDTVLLYLTAQRRYRGMHRLAQSCFTCMS